MATEIGRAQISVGFEDSELQAGLTAASNAVKAKIGAAASVAEGELQRVQAAAAQAAAAVDKTASRVAAATSREADARGKLRVAEERLNEVRAQGNASASRVAAAEEAVAKATRGHEAASRELAKAKAADVTASKRHATAIDAVKTATVNAENATNSSAGKMGGSWRVLGKNLDGVKGKLSGLHAAIGGLAVGAAVGGTVSFLSGLAKDAEEAAIVGRQTEAVIRATGGAAKMSAGQVGDLATAISNKTGVDDEAIQTGANLLLTFKNVRNEAGQGANMFDRATTAAVDLSKAGFGSVDSASKMLGKALNDPAKGMTALSRAGVTFTAQQQAQVKAMVASGDVLGAQKVIMAEVEGQVGGVAAASASASERMATVWGNAREAVGEKLLAPMTGLADFMADKLPAAIDVTFAKVEAVKEWATANAGWLQPLAFGVGTAAAAMGAYAFATSAAATATAILTSPVTAVVAAIAAVTAGFVWLYQNNETFRTNILAAWTQIQAVVQTAWTGYIQPALTAFWSWITTQLVPAVMGFWQGTVVPAFTAIGAFIAATWSGIIKPALSALWTFLTTVVAPVISWLWVSVVRPVFAAIGGFIATTWNNVIKPVFGFIVAVVRDVLAPVFSWLWNTIIRPVFGWIGAFIGATWNAVIKPVLLAVVGFVKLILGPVWTWLSGIIKRVFEGVTGFITGFWGKSKAVLDGTIGFVRGVFVGAFTWARDKIGGVWSAITGFIGKAKGKIDGFMDGINKAMNSVWSFAGVVRDGIAQAWEGIKKAFGAPIEWVGKNVFGKLSDAWNSAAGMLGGAIKKMSFPEIKLQYATGGYTGPGGKYEPAGIVHRGEYVIRKESTRKLMRERPGLLESLNRRGAPGYSSGGHVGALAGVRGMPGYARGGWAKPWPVAVGAAVRKLFGHKGAQGGYGSRPGPSDHGTGNAIDFMVPDSSPLGDAIAAWGAANHEALRLKYIIWKKQIIGSGRWGGWRPYTRYGNSKNRTLQHYDHPHFSFVHDSWGNPAVLAKGLSPEMLESLKNAAGSMFGGINPFDALKEQVAKLVEKVPGSGGWTDMVKQVPLTLVDKLGSFIGDKLALMGGPGTNDQASDIEVPAGSGVTRWSSLVLQALKMVGEPASLLPVVLRRMNQESTGNPRAINNWDINAKRGIPSKGLMQVIDPTFRQYAMPGHNTNIYDPLSNILASMRYAQGRYGSLAKAYNRKGGYAEGGLVDGEQPQGLARGGRVRGRSPHRRADNVPIRATAGEWMMQQPAAAYYGDGVMGALNSMRVPIEALAGYATGGKVAPAPLPKGSGMNATKVAPVQVPLVPVWPTNVAKLIRDDLSRLLVGEEEKAENPVAAKITEQYTKIRDAFAGVIKDRVESKGKLDAANKAVIVAEKTLTDKLAKAKKSQKDAILKAEKALRDATLARGRAGAKQNDRQVDAARELAVARKALATAKAAKITGKSRATQQKNLAAKNKAVAAATKRVTAAEKRLKTVGGSEAVAASIARVQAAQEKLNQARRKGVDVTAQQKALDKARAAQIKAKKEHDQNEANAKAAEKIGGILDRYRPKMQGLAFDLEQVRTGLSWTSPTGEVITGMESLTQHVDGLRKAAADYAATVTQGIMSKASITTLFTGQQGESGTSDGGIAGIIAGLKDTIAKTREFGGLVSKLKGLGLNEAMLEQVRGAGLDGLDLAKALAASTPSTIAELNGLQSELQASAKGLGDQFAQDVYGDQIAAADAVFKAWKARESDLTKMMKDLGTAMRAEFDAAFAGRPSPAAPQKVKTKRPTLAQPQAPAAGAGAPIVHTTVVLDGKEIDARARIVVYDEFGRVVDAARVKAGGGVR